MALEFLTKVFGTKSDRDIKRIRPIVERIKLQEEEYQTLSEAQLKAKTDEFKERLRNGETVNDIMIEAFAVVKNACRRLCGIKFEVCGHENIWNMVPFDVQLIGAIVLNRSSIAEMATGEGKTLVATLPLYLNALTGKNCQLVTVSDYHARRDAEWMGLLYEYLGLTVGCIQNDMEPEERREMYEKDITYGTNSEFGFDYLRDMGMSTAKDQLVQRDHYFVIIDEVDSILIDEARTPLIISGPAAVSSHQYDKYKPLVSNIYRKQNLLCSRLIEEAKAVLNKENTNAQDRENAFKKLVQVKLGMPKHKQLMRLLQDGTLLKQFERVEGNIKSDQNRGLLQEVKEDLYFSVDEKSHEADLTEKGRNEISPNDPEAFVLPDLLSELHNIDSDQSLTEQEKIKRKQEFQDKFGVDSERIQNISQLIKAYCLFERDVNYVIKDGKVVIVDEHTGRLMPGRRFNEGLHQALEAKEDVAIEGETQTFASITIQNYFRMYDKLSGMTGTAESEATEFHQIYEMDVIMIPTNKPCIRKDFNDAIYRTKREKYNAIANEVQECHKRGQPVLLGTVSVDVSEVISRMLKRRKIPHNVLNAKNHEREADIVARAGQRGMVTVATNMAGRGTDIKLGEGVAELGGLYVVGSARHDSRRIDRQLRGRCARQGDPGASKFYISLEDDLMRLFGSDKISSVMGKLGLNDGEELQHPLLNRSIETAQKRVEQQHFGIRKRTLDYDDVLNKQREIIYGFRKEVLLTDTPREILLDIVYDEIGKKIDLFEEATDKNTDFDYDSFLNWLNTTFPLGFIKSDLQDSESNLLRGEELNKKAYTKVEDAYKAKEAVEDQESLSNLQRYIILDAVDRLWQEHLYAMDGMRSGIMLRSYAQKDPLVEYKHEAFEMFTSMMNELNQEILNNMFRSATKIEAFEQIFANLPQELIHKEIEQFGQDKSGYSELAAQHMQGQEDEMPENYEEALRVETYHRETAKVGRNDPCPCGSGKKYKKCCGK
ncbi:MAG: preprotein translocase subunit SecA [Victivallales bacterium]|nr:preprotein translocase subunit SecA [Victivallales bacterium]MCF7889107.1 preprotein translocase subunit SecA [Victivallales bacterium]